MAEVELTKGYDRVARAMTDTIKAVKDTLRAKVTSLVTECRKVYGGNEIPTADLSAIADQVATECGWKGSVVKVRKSEVRALVAAYTQLQVASDKYMKATGNIGYHVLVGLARKLRDGKTAHQAVQAMIKREPKGDASPIVVIQNAAKKLAKVNARAGSKPRAFIDDFAKLCAKHNIAFE